MLNLTLSVFIKEQFLQKSHTSEAAVEKKSIRHNLVHTTPGAQESPNFVEKVLFVKYNAMEICNFHCNWGRKCVLRYIDPIVWNHCRVRLMANKRKETYLENTKRNKPKTCNIYLSFVTRTVLSLIFSHSALYFEHARTCSLPCSTTLHTFLIWPWRQMTSICRGRYACE